MTGIKHSGNDLIIYDTPQESRTSRGFVPTSTSYTTVTSAAQVTYESSETTTQSTDMTPMVDDTSGGGTINYDTTTPTQSSPTQSSPPPSSSPPSSPPPSSPPPSSGGGGGYSGY